MEETHTKPTLCRGPQPVGVLQWPRRLQMAARQQRNEYGGERTRKRMKERDGFLLGGETTPHHSKDRNDEKTLKRDTLQSLDGGVEFSVIRRLHLTFSPFPTTLSKSIATNPRSGGEKCKSLLLCLKSSLSLSLCKRGGSVCKNIRLVSTASSRQLSEERRMNVG